ncbi:hypothetical protein HELRODRAFT_168928 [Helobdella robusta]|uniref:Uncharacterized protein n=1 Tax=Helobdella robusta TaxID=6412 RepID=T1F155_HELRO|nr:hypothetical protein HELRODRAFT_168928 [Helobdella robusta]ESO08998.1 hypothetical protein HELRODRAFT_168928 [Helobdella robusta]
MYEEIHLYFKKLSPTIKKSSRNKYLKDDEEHAKIKIKREQNGSNYKTLTLTPSTENSNSDSKFNVKNSTNNHNMSLNNQCSLVCQQCFNPGTNYICYPQPTNAIKYMSNSALKPLSCQPCCQPCSQPVMECFSKRPAPLVAQAKVLNKPQPYIAFTPSISPPCSPVCQPQCLSPCPQPCIIPGPVQRPIPPQPICYCIQCSPCLQSPLLSNSPTYLSGYSPTCVQQCSSPAVQQFCVPQITVPKTILCESVQPKCTNIMRQKNITSCSPGYVTKRHHKCSKSCSPCCCPTNESAQLMKCPCVNVPIQSIEQRKENLKKNHRLKKVSIHPTQQLSKSNVQKKIHDYQQKLRNKQYQPKKYGKYSSRSPFSKYSSLRDNSKSPCTYKCFLLSSSEHGNEYQCLRTDVLLKDRVLANSIKKRQQPLKLNNRKISQDVVVEKMNMGPSNLIKNRQLPLKLNNRKISQDIVVEKMNVNPISCDTIYDQNTPLSLRGRNHPCSCYYNRNRNFIPRQNCQPCHNCFNQHCKCFIRCPYRSNSLPRMPSYCHGYPQSEFNNYSSYKNNYDLPNEFHQDDDYMYGSEYDVIDDPQSEKYPFRSHSLPPQLFPVTKTQRTLIKPPVRNEKKISFHPRGVSQLRRTSRYNDGTYDRRYLKNYPTKGMHLETFGSGKNYEEEQVVMLDADIEDGGVYEFDYNMLQANNNYGFSSSETDDDDYENDDDYDDYYDVGCGDCVEDEYVYDSYLPRYDCNYFCDYQDEIPYEIEEIVLLDQPNMMYCPNYFHCPPKPCCCCNSCPMPVTNMFSMQDNSDLIHKLSGEKTNCKAIDAKVKKALEKDPTYCRLMKERDEIRVQKEVDKILNSILMKRNMLNCCNKSCCCSPCSPVCPCTNYFNQFYPCRSHPICSSSPCCNSQAQVIVVPSFYGKSSSSSSSSNCLKPKLFSRSKSCKPCSSHLQTMVPITGSPSCIPQSPPNIYNWLYHSWPGVGSSCGTMGCYQPPCCNPCTK